LQKLRSVQVLRAVAALLVVWAHASNTVYGRVGVDIFFVISGFIIARIAARREPVRFIIDRVWRIYPVYWIAVLPWVALAYSLNASTPDRLAATITLWPVYGEYVQPYLRPAWSLCFEMLFYAAMFVATVTKKGRWLIAAFIGCFLFNLAYPTPLTSFLGSWHIFEFLFGLWLSRRPVESIEPPFSSPLWNPAVFLGDASYSIYLVHMLITETSAAPWPARFVGAVALGYAFHLTVERPILKLNPKTLSSWDSMTKRARLSPQLPCQPDPHSR
jgi:exopolysaccharide production protein ExoZ